MDSTVPLTAAEKRHLKLVGEDGVDPLRFPRDRVTLVHWPAAGHGTVPECYSAYLGHVWLACEDTRDEAQHQAEFVLRCYRNGGIYARETYLGLAHYDLGALV